MQLEFLKEEICDQIPSNEIAAQCANLTDEFYPQMVQLLADHDDIPFYFCSKLDACEEPEEERQDDDDG